jgi:hypothetical protein
MTTDGISDQSLSEIAFLFAIAKANGTLISIQDISALTSVGLTEEDLRRAWKSTPQLSNTYKLQDDLILEVRAEPERSTRDIADEVEKRKRAQEYISIARHFSGWCVCNQASLLSVSGSTSYFAPSEKDDLDFFVVSRRDSLWILLPRLLILARVFRFIHKRSPRICFSYAIDESFAERDFASPKDPLSARDALTAVVIHGSGLYLRLLKNNDWISKFYPRLYERRTRETASDPVKATEPYHSPARLFVNLFSLRTVGFYVRLKSELLNRKFRSERKNDARFSVKIATDHLVFESDRYTRLRNMYRNFPSGARSILWTKVVKER